MGNDDEVYSIKWGIAGAGRISHDFVASFSMLHKYVYVCFLLRSTQVVRMKHLLFSRSRTCMSRK